MPAMLNAATASRAARALPRIALRERRRLTLPRPTRLLKLGPQPLDVRAQTRVLRPQPANPHTTTRIRAVFAHTPNPHPTTNARIPARRPPTHTPATFAAARHTPSRRVRRPLTHYHIPELSLDRPAGDRLSSSHITHGSRARDRRVAGRAHGPPQPCDGVPARGDLRDRRRPSSRDLHSSSGEHRGQDSPGCLCPVAAALSGGGGLVTVAASIQSQQSDKPTGEVSTCLRPSPIRLTPDRCGIGCGSRACASGRERRAPFPRRPWLNNTAARSQ